MKKILMLAGSLLIVMGVKAQKVNVKKETTPPVKTNTVFGGDGKPILKVANTQNKAANIQNKAANVQNKVANNQLKVSQKASALKTTQLKVSTQAQTH